MFNERTSNFASVGLVTQDLCGPYVMAQWHCQRASAQASRCGHGIVKGLESRVSGFLKVKRSCH